MRPILLAQSNIRRQQIAQIATGQREVGTILLSSPQLLDVMSRQVLCET
ncbi:MAG: hypothetical protein ACJAVI_001419 [Candidatus Azotimanducaceae bacterium]|jgi:hypothetical protein